MALDKLRTLRARGDLNALLEVDGGVGPETIGACAEAGADLFVTGSAIFRNEDYPTAVRELRAAAKA